jgi:hypothetical protein
MLEYRAKVVSVEGENVRDSLHTRVTLNYSLRLYGLFVCVPEP